MRAEEQQVWSLPVKDTPVAALDQLLLPLAMRVPRNAGLNAFDNKVAVGATVPAAVHPDPANWEMGGEILRLAMDFDIPVMPVNYPCC